MDITKAASVEHGAGRVMASAFTDASGTGPWQSDSVLNSAVYGAILSAQIQSNAAKPLKTHHAGDPQTS